MAEQLWQWLSNSGTIVTAATILFFTGKGILWLLLPGLVIRHAHKRSRKATHVIEQENQRAA